MANKKKKYAIPQYCSKCGETFYESHHISAETGEQICGACAFQEKIDAMRKESKKHE